MIAETLLIASFVFSKPGQQEALLYKETDRYESIEMCIESTKWMQEMLLEASYANKIVIHHMEIRCIPPNLEKGNAVHSTKTKR